ncbi:hypothetical protein [Runella sp.]|jgi:mRNA-degrading endonuclease RelE of RelBE toxin-antitoxin system|uniref:hypothetical protein n=1 Tax=Runella sp. TaxID=1960881 RepID=UPI003017A443
MSFEIKVTPDFQRRAKRLVKKYASLKSEVESLVGQLRENPTLGVSLGANAYKIRLSVKSKGGGKSGGIRIISVVVFLNNRVYLADIYDKSEQSTLTDKELKRLIEEIENE